MLGHYKIFTVTHRQCSLQKIGQFVLKEKDSNSVSEQLTSLKKTVGIEELFYLPTCNRVTYFFYTKAVFTADFKQAFFQELNSNLQADDLEQVLGLEGEPALNHLFEVAASIDSLVVGEREILRQLRHAYQQSKDWNLTGDHIRLAMDFMVKAAKEVYDQTKIGERPISIVSLAVKKMLAYKLKKESRILVIGAGQTNSLVCKFLKKHVYENVVVFNRSPERAKKLAQFIGGEGYALADLEKYRGGFDAMFVCTAATEAIIHKDNYCQLLQGSNEEKLIIDLGIPNNVDKDIVNYFKINYIEIEDLKNLAKKNLSYREKEVSLAQAIVKKNLEEFRPIHKQRQLEKAMRQIPEEIKAIREKALNEVFKKELETLDDSSKELVVKMMEYMEKKCIGIPMKVARKVIIK